MGDRQTDQRLATGNIGSDLIEMLSDVGEDVRALTRNPAKITPRDGVERVVLLSTSAAASGDSSSSSSTISRSAIESEDVVRRSGLGWTVLRAYGFMSNTLRWLPELKAGDVVKDDRSPGCRSRQPPSSG
jgi:uncharacterized protein YbjT (DUF2867 family)